MSKSRKTAAFGLAAAALLVIFLFASINTGAAQIGLRGVWDALFAFDPENTMHLLVRDMRLVRALSGAAVGASLAVAGAMMQGMTRNPMADSGLMGLSAGAGFAISLCVSVLGFTRYNLVLLSSFAGALLGAAGVYAISALVPGSETRVKLVLSGAMLSTFLSALSQAIAIQSGKSQSLMFWTLGNLSGISWGQFLAALPFLAAGVLLSLLLSPRVTILSLTDEVAAGLGVRVGAVKALGTLAVVLMAGTSFVLAGNITFVGLLTAHFCRFLAGPDYRRVIPLSALFGGVLVVLADTLAKGIAPPVEYPVGALISLIGVPVFLYYARRKAGK